MPSGTGKRHPALFSPKASAVTGQLMVDRADNPEEYHRGCRNRW
jgi:hypothetical protein